MRHIYNQHTLTVLRKELSLIRKDYLELKKAITIDIKTLLSKKKILSTTLPSIFFKYK